jgi:choline dehydrogenase
MRHAREIAATPPLAASGRQQLAPGPSDWSSDAALRRWLRRNVWTYHHPVGTCRMGPRPAEGAVVDRRGRVHGLENVYVADASVMPAIPSANTNLPTIMVAERIAAMLVEP